TSCCLLRLLLSIDFMLVRPPPTSTLFPYTTLFRSQDAGRRCTTSAANTVLQKPSSSTTSAPVGWMSTTRQYRDRPPVISNLTSRSEERRVGKECRSRRAPSE